jgi:hypothetical protein
MMTLIWNWKAVLKKAWSIKFILGAGFLSGVEVILPMLDIQFGPPWMMPLITLFVVAGAFVARIVAQPAITRLP